MSTLNPNQTLLQGKNQSPSDKTPAPLTGPSQYVSFNFQKIDPPSILYVNVDDVLVLQSASSQANESITVNVRLMLPGGRIEDMQFVQNPAATRTPIRQTFGLAEGYLLSVTAIAAVATTRGQTFLRVSIQRGLTGSQRLAQILCADYITTLAAPAYPNGRVSAPTEGPGLVYAVLNSGPGAGLDFSQTIPVNARWKIRCFNAQFATSAAAGNRDPQIIVRVLGTNAWIASALAHLVASTNYNISFTGFAPYTEILTPDVMIPIPPDLVVTGQAVGTTFILSSTVGLLAGDVWSNINFLVEEWLENV